MAGISSARVAAINDNINSTGDICIEKGKPGKATGSHDMQVVVAADGQQPDAVELSASSSELELQEVPSGPKVPAHYQVTMIMATFNTLSLLCLLARHCWLPAEFRTSCHARTAAMHALVSWHPNIQQLATAFLSSSSISWCGMLYGLCPSATSDRRLDLVVWMSVHVLLAAAAPTEDGASGWLASRL